MPADQHVYKSLLLLLFCLLLPLLILFLQNCHAYANASFHAVVNPDTGVVTEQPRIYYGGVQKTLVG